MNTNNINYQQIIDESIAKVYEWEACCLFPHVEGFNEPINIFKYCCSKKKLEKKGIETHKRIIFDQKSPYRMPR